MSEETEATPKRGTLDVIHRAVCKNCGHEITKDADSDFMWEHDHNGKRECES